jgi:hypothetical protein
MPLAISATIVAGATKVAPFCHFLSQYYCLKTHPLFLATKLHKVAQRKKDSINNLNKKFLEVRKGAGSPDLLKVAFIFLFSHQ